MNVATPSDFLLHEKYLFEHWCICGPPGGPFDSLYVFFLYLVFLVVFGEDDFATTAAVGYWIYSLMFVGILSGWALRYQSL